MNEEYKMKEELKLFLQKAANDTALQEKLQGCKSPEEAYAIASSVQEGFTFEEFVEAGQKLNDMAESQDLTDEDLAKAAGGASTGEIVATAVGSAASVSTLVWAWCLL
jgi:predicted ribosomally synthesized peptide with nif11-like leader